MEASIRRGWYDLRPFRRTINKAYATKTNLNGLLRAPVSRPLFGFTIGQGALASRAFGNCIWVLPQFPCRVDRSIGP